jgi:hypothetical protein
MVSEAPDHQWNNQKKKAECIPNLIAYSLPFIKFFISEGEDTISHQASGDEIRKTNGPTWSRDTGNTEIAMRFRA